MSKHMSATIDATDGTTVKTFELDDLSVDRLANRLWEAFPQDTSEGDDEPDTDEIPGHVTLSNPTGFAVHLFMFMEGAQQEMEPVVNFDELLEAWSEADDDRKEAMGEYLDDMGADDLSDFDEAYQGQFDNGAAFAEHDSEQHVPDSFPAWMVIDWEATWERNLRHDYHITDSGHVFRNM